MQKFIIFALSLFLLSCESEEIDVSKPVDLDKAVALFCKEANKELPKGSHVIVRKKDFESINNASKEYIHWKIMQNFTERKGINAYGNDNITTQDLKDKGEIFTVKVSLKEWAGLPYFKGFFYMDKNGVKATDVSVLRKEYAIQTDPNLNSLLKEQAKEDSALPEEQQAKENSKGTLKIINESKGYLIGIRVYRSNSLLVDGKIDIPYNGEEIRKLESGEYRLEIKDDYNDKFCSVGTFKMANEQTQTITYRGCK